jgi:hypothetical protein
MLLMAASSNGDVRGQLAMTHASLKMSANGAIVREMSSMCATCVLAIASLVHVLATSRTSDWRTRLSSTSTGQNTQADFVSRICTILFQVSAPFAAKLFRCNSATGSQHF